MVTDKLEYAKINSELEYQDKSRRECVGTVFEVDVLITSYQKQIVYRVIDELDEIILVDGETFMQI